MNKVATLDTLWQAGSPTATATTKRPQRSEAAFRSHPGRLNHDVRLCLQPIMVTLNLAQSNRSICSQPVARVDGESKVPPSSSWSPLRSFNPPWGGRNESLQRQTMQTVIVMQSLRPRQVRESVTNSPPYKLRFTDYRKSFISRIVTCVAVPSRPPSLQSRQEGNAVILEVDSK